MGRLSVRRWVRHALPIPCHYRLVNATTTHYHSFWLTADGRIADFWSSTE